MKKLVKVRIINWHYFYNVTFDIDQVNFLTGQNAAGKSTLIDAMQVVLLGDTSGRQFNKAASEKAGRTLKGYLKGEIGDDGEGSYRYLRNGRFSSYIALQWYDDVNDKYFTTGIVFDVYEDSSEEHHFFILEDKIPENNFVVLQVPMSYKQLNEYFSKNYAPSEFYFADSNAQYQSRIKDEFGGIKDKYFSLFKKAVSFTPITNIEQFLTEYVCDVPSEINVESMRNNIQQYKRLEIEASNMKQKITRLEEIQNAYNEYNSKKQDLNVASYVSKRITYQVYLNTISNFQKDISSSETRLQEISSELTSIEDKIKDLNKQKENLIAQKVSSGAFQLTSELSTQKDATEKKINEITNQLNTLRNQLSKYINDYSNTANQIISICASIKEDRTYISYKKELESLITSSEELLNNVNTFKGVFTNTEAIDDTSLTSFRDALIKYKSDVFELGSRIRSKYSDLVLEHTHAKQQLSDLDNGSKNYDLQLINIRRELEHRLSDYYGKQVPVTIFADLVDIKTPRWVNAIEGFVGSQKQNMFVDNEYYETANKILPEILRKQQYYRTGLIDQEKLHKANFVIDDDSLAEEIITEHQGARDYANFLLGKMIKCESFHEARKTGRGITPKCEGYRNFASFVIPEKNYRYPLMGRKISDELKKAKKLEVEQNEKVINTLKALTTALTLVNSLDTLSSNELETAGAILENAATLDSLKENVARYQEELSNTGSIEVSSIEGKIARIEQDIKNLEDDKQELVLERGKLQESIRNIQDEKIPAQIQASNEVLEQIKNSFDEEFVNNIALPKFNEELATGRSLISIRSEYEDIFVRSQNKMRSLFNALNELRREYCLTYKLSYDTTKEVNDDFDNELTLLRDVKLPEYQDKIASAYTNATKEFKDDFIFKLKTSIETVRSQIDDLNEALKDAKFGNDSYQFTVTPAPQYKEYYDMITDNLLLTCGDDENAYFEKYQEVMNSLFKLIGDVSASNDQSSVLAQNVEKFTDYRTYLMFDMLVKKGEGKAYSLAKNIKKQSGGETQTPFYVSILASFSQLYRIRATGAQSNCIRLVIFDEAFSKMDSTRIIESIKILKNFGLQVILSAPSEKVSDLAKLVDKTLLVSRQNNRSQVDTFEIKK
jgi:uncharacterized protein YPO0396